MIEGRTALEHNRHSAMRWPSDSLNVQRRRNDTDKDI